MRASARSDSTCSRLSSRGTTSTTQTEPSAKPSGVTMGAPA